MEIGLLRTGMAEVAKLLYIVVVDEGEKLEKEKGSFRYTRHVLQSTLQLMGCKPRHAFKVCLFSFFNHTSGFHAKSSGRFSNVFFSSSIFYIFSF